ncbi:probable starch synthase 4, chloroplastic/amyloplastic [Diospyros lotus]|uniref:probable starch synthase 4, chloroplastic/amyloplastic n=1 Tax=Diospyros lotus TaxID=55363 RepID=UPI002258CE75|nr:probable starch synthase 4, chloroplastic/amyloplastic [Diospyros lotus]
MQGYDRDGYEDFSEYEEDVEEEGEEEYEEEEEAPQPTQEELEYLELRQQLKDSFRKQIKKESGSSHVNSQEKKKKLPYENFGSFFGPSKPVIAQRVIQESKSLLENHHMAAKVAKPYHEKSKSSSSTTTGSKSQVRDHRPKAVNELKTKVQKLKDTRDYSFLLSDDAQIPAPTKDHPSRNFPARNSEARSTQVPARSKQSLTNTGRQVPNGREERKPLSTSSQMLPKSGPPRTPASKPIQKAFDPRKQIGNSNGSGPGRPVGPKSLPSKTPAATTERRVSAAGAKSSVPSVHRPPASKLHSSASKQVLKHPLDMKKEFQESSRAKQLPKQPVPSSKPQINKPPVKISSRPTIREDRPKKRPARRYSDDEDDDDGGRAISMIRSMFGYNPNKYADDDEDDMDMEANFDDIMREEDRSARIARKEDEEELRKIEEEERRERLRKKRKLSQRVPGLCMASRIAAVFDSYMIPKTYYLETIKVLRACCEEKVGCMIKFPPCLPLTGWLEDSDEDLPVAFSLPPAVQTDMSTVLHASVHCLPAFPKTTGGGNSKSLKSRARLRSLGKNRMVNDFSGGSFRMELTGHDNSEISQEVMNSVPEKKHEEIGRLFKEAQRNILYLNKQRMMAMVELDKTYREKTFLLGRIEQLERKNKSYFGKDKLSISSELLLRVDSMVLTGMIGAGEASDLRRMIVDSKFSIANELFEILHRRDVELLAALRHFSDKSRMKGFHIVHICTEMAPIISIGSLASYVTGLSCALLRKGHLVEVILPKYSSLNLDEVQGLREIEAEFYSYFNGQLHVNRIWTGVLYGIGITFIQPIYYSSFFNGERVYGYSNDFERFSYFSRASLDYIVKSGKQPDVLHIHNWQTAVIGPLFWDVFVKQGLGGTRILLTCHGFDSQCLEQPNKLALCGLDPSRLHRPDRLQDNSKTHLANILKGGIVYSNKVIIMSSVHSKDTIISCLSQGLESTLAIHKDKLLLAPYGFDNATWNPSVDKYLPQTYSADDVKGKAVCKVELQQQLRLSENASTVLVGCIFSGVLDIDLENFKALVLAASRKGVQFVFMGTGKVPGINWALETFQEELQDDCVRFLNEYDEALSHLIFAGSDIVLCQSFHDPLLQVPLKAVRYGAAPVAATLIDKHFRQVIDHDHDSSQFSRYIANTFGHVSLSQAIDEICLVQLQKNNPAKWNRKIMDAMTKDFSWDAECCDIHVSAYTSIKNL